MAFVENHFSMSDRSQPPETCFGGKSPFLHQRKSVERLTPTTRTTSLVLMRTSMPASRSAIGDRFGLAARGLGELRTGGMTSTSGSCTGRFPVTTSRRLEAVRFERRRIGGGCISRDLAIVLPDPLETATTPGDGMEVLIALCRQPLGRLVIGPVHHLAGSRGRSLPAICASWRRFACCRLGRRRDDVCQLALHCIHTNRRQSRLHGRIACRRNADQLAPESGVGLPSRPHAVRVALCDMRNRLDSESRQNRCAFRGEAENDGRRLAV